MEKLLEDLAANLDKMADQVEAYSVAPHDQRRVEVLGEFMHHTYTAMLAVYQLLAERAGN